MVFCWLRHAMFFFSLWIASQIHLILVSFPECKLQSKDSRSSQDKSQAKRWKYRRWTVEKKKTLSACLHSEQDKLSLLKTTVLFSFLLSCSQKKIVRYSMGTFLFVLDEETISTQIEIALVSWNFFSDSGTLRCIILMQIVFSRKHLNINNHSS